MILALVTEPWSMGSYINRNPHLELDLPAEYDNLNFDITR